MSKPKRAPGPWRVAYKQVNQQGVGSRPYLVDANGDPVNLNQKGNATLAALAPSMLAALEQAEYEARLWFLMLKGEHPGITKPQWLQDAEHLVRAASSIAK